MPAPVENAPSASPQRVLRVEIGTRTLIAIVVTVACVYMLTRLVPVLLTLVAALMLVGALNPLVRWLEGKRVRRSVAIALVLGGAVAMTALVLFLTLPSLIAQARAVVENEPQIRARVVAFLDHSPLTHTLADQLRNADYTQLLKDSRNTVLKASLHAFELMAYAIAVIFLCLYVMVDRDRLRAAVFAVIPRKYHVRSSRVLLNLETIVGGYIRGQVITCVLIGIFIFTLLLLCHVPNALALAVFGALMDVLPYIGPLLTVIPAVAAAYAVSPAVAITVFVLLVLYEEFEGRVLIPLVYGRALRLPSSVVFFALLAGVCLDGVAGALLALPIASAALMLIEELRVDLPGTAELSSDLDARRKDAREEREYARRTEDAPVTEASAVAVELARERKQQEAGAESRTGKSESPES
jgi:predicted PurR-regulated permease PerM